MSQAYTDKLVESHFIIEYPSPVWGVEIYETKTFTEQNYVLKNLSPVGNCL